MAQPHQGDRILLGTRVPRELGHEFQARARAAGTSASDYLAQLVRQHLETTALPDLADGELISRREVAQLSKSA